MLSAGSILCLIFYLLQYILYILYNDINLVYLYNLLFCTHALVMCVWVCERVYVTNALPINTSILDKHLLGRDGIDFNGVWAFRCSSFIYIEDIKQGSPVRNVNISRDISLDPIINKIIGVLTIQVYQINYRLPTYNTIFGPKNLSYIGLKKINNLPNQNQSCTSLEFRRNTKHLKQNV